MASIRSSFQFGRITRTRLVLSYSRVFFNATSPFQTELIESQLNKFTHMYLASCYHEIIRLIELEDPQHRLNIVGA